MLILIAVDKKGGTYENEAAQVNQAKSKQGAR
jgi:hypothetical protein